LTLFDNSLLLNIDRLASDDYKGVGEGYSKMITNTFRLKVAIVSATEHPERVWQKQYDEALLGFVTSGNPSLPPATLNDQPPIMLKYTVFSLNKDEFVLRLFNMAEQLPAKVPKYSKKEWLIPELGINLQFADVKESFANGVVLGERKNWTNIQGEVSIFTAGSQDTPTQLHLDPLQIRSFRINIKNTIVAVASKKPEEELTSLPVTDIKLLQTPFLKRCF
jgi:hypothetical protein